LVFTAGAQACSCLELNPRAALRQADAAVVARLVRVEPVDHYGADYIYLVRRVYKGGKGIRAGETISVRSGINGASCGLPDDKVRWYGLFLSHGGDLWRGGLCGLAAPRELAAAAGGLHRGDDLAGSAASSASPDCAS